MKKVQRVHIIKEEVKEEVKEKKITTDELRRLNELESLRNSLALSLGVITYNWQKALDEHKTQIEKYISEQKQLGELILSLYDCDSKKQNYNIDLTTGLISVV